MSARILAGIDGLVTKIRVVLVTTGQDYGFGRPDGTLRFRWVKAPTSAELARLTQALALGIGVQCLTHRDSPPLAQGNGRMNRLRSCLTAECIAQPLVPIPEPCDVFRLTP